MSAANKNNLLHVNTQFIIFVIVFSAFSVLKAQSPRSLINDGVDLYKSNKYTDSEVNFKKGMEKLPNNFNAYFNLGDAQYKQERYDEAIKAYQQSLAKTTDENLKAKAFHNIGNSLLKSQKYKESVDAYKNALRLNPKDEETKYNLSYALNMLKQNQQQQKNDKNNKQNKDQNKQDQNKQDQNNKDKNKDQNKDQQNKDNKDQQNKDQQNNQDNKDQKNNPQDQKSQAQQNKDKMNKEEAERILNAIKNNEQDLQQKLRKHEGKPIKTDKDW